MSENDERGPKIPDDVRRAFLHRDPDAPMERTMVPINQGAIVSAPPADLSAIASAKADAPDREAADLTAAKILADVQFKSFSDRVTAAEAVGAAILAERAANQALRLELHQANEAAHNLHAKYRESDAARIEAERKLADARAEERKACAKIADNYMLGVPDTSPSNRGLRSGCIGVARAIRARQS